MSGTTSFSLILVLWTAGLGAAAQYAKISVIFDRLPSVYPDAGAALGFVVSLVGMVGIFLGVVAGLVVARVGYRRALLWALWGGAAISLIQALLPPLSVFLISRVAEGVSHLAIVVAAPTLIAQLSANRHRGLTLTLWSTFFSVSFSLIVAFGLPLVDAWGIPALFLVHAFWMGLVALILSLRLEPLRPTSQPGSFRARRLLSDHLEIYRSPFIAAPAAGWLFYTFCFLGILTVLPPYMPDASRAWTLGLMPLVAIVSSMTIGVRALSYVPAISVVQTGFVMTVLSLLWLLYQPGLPLPCFAFSASLGLIQGASFASVPQLNHTPETQAQANGAMAQAGNLGNTLGTPILLWMLTIAGYPGLVWTSVTVLGCGFFVHMWMAHRRARECSC